MAKTFLTTSYVVMLVVRSCSGAPIDPPIDRPRGEAGPSVDAGASTDAGHGAACRTTSLASGVAHPDRDPKALYSIEVDGRIRTFKVYVPVGYDSSRPVPLLVVIHGIGKRSDQFVADSDLVRVADASGFVTVYPDPDGLAWNAGSCCAGDDARDDVVFFRAMIDYVRDELALCIDPSRTYATGLSNGGMMTYRLACEASDVFAAVASVSGSLAIDAAECALAQTRPVPLLEIHGNGDVFVGFDVAEQSIADYAGISGCGTSSRPALQPVSALDTTCVTHDGCPSGMELTICLVEDGGHCWYGGPSCGGGVPGGAEIFGRNAYGIVAADAVWGFVSRFDCPTCGP